MTRFRPSREKAVTVIALQAGCALALLCGVTLWVSNAQAAPLYDDGAGNGCVSCHSGFQGGNGALHTRHRVDFGVTTCNLCHPSGGGTTPVSTYTSGAGGGFGCAGCHGQDYGETSPNSGQPKATSYGLRQFHVNQGVTTCGTSGCHQPGALGSPDPFPPLYGEHVKPPYYDPAFSNLTDPCSSAQEDFVFDVDSVGLDNDGNGFADYPADADCVAFSTTTTTGTSTTTSTSLPFACGPAPAGGCVAPTKGVLFVSEQTAGKEKLKVSLKKLEGTVTVGQFGDPVAGTTAYNVCIYDGTNQLTGEYRVARAGDTCGTKPCWKAIPDKGYKYSDKSAASDGILKIIGFAGDGTGKVKVVGKNIAGTLPLGVAAALQNQTSAVVQVVTSDAGCFGADLTLVKKADGTIFKAVGP
jgi:hypothetical protein